MCCFSFFTEPGASLRCLCNDTQGVSPLSCIVNGFSCESTAMCFVQRLWSREQGRAFSVWGCLDDLATSFILGKVCLINDTVRGNVYFCCNNTDYCNNVTLRLPHEMSVTITESVMESVSRSASTSPSASTEGKGGWKD